MPGTAKGPTFSLHYPISYEEQDFTLFTPGAGRCIHQIADFGT